VVNAFLLGNCNTMELTDCQSRHNCSSGLNSNSVRQRRFVNNFFDDKRHPVNLKYEFREFRELGQRQVSKLCFENGPTGVRSVDFARRFR
jgi:hypothetical protein